MKKCGQILLLFVTLWFAESEALSDEAAFKAQFLNVSEEVKVAGGRYEGYEIIEHRVSREES